MLLLHSSEKCPRHKGLTYTEVNFDHEGDLRWEVVDATGHRTVPVCFDVKGEQPIFIGGSDHLMDYLPDSIKPNQPFFELIFIWSIWFKLTMWPFSCSRRVTGHPADSNISACSIATSRGTR